VILKEAVVAGSSCYRAQLWRTEGNKELSENVRCRDRDSKEIPPAHKCRALPLLLSVRFEYRTFPSFMCHEFCSTDNGGFRVKRYSCCSNIEITEVGKTG
jgi:hypothetical protein